MQLAHAADDRLAGVFVTMYAERWVFLGQRLQGTRELVLVGLGLRLDRHVDDRLGEVQALQDDRVVLVAEGVAGGRVLEPDQSDDVAGISDVVRLTMVGVHLDDPPDAFLAVACRVEDRVALGEHARIDAGEDELAEVLVSHDLERKGRKGLLVVSQALHVLLALQVLALGGRDVERAREEADDGIEHRLDALVLEGCPAEHWDRLARDRRPSQGATKEAGRDPLFV